MLKLGMLLNVTENPTPIKTDTWTDYSHELRVAKNPTLRIICASLGFACSGLGIIGLFVPGWPTTIWLLLAIYFFGRSSPRYYNWIMNHRLFGPLIRDWKAGLGITHRAKILAVFSITVGIGISVLLISNVGMRTVLVFIGLAVSTYLITRPTKRGSTN
jgi:uncharacterized membrane protein YbaN (DUF454 family)